MEKEYEYKGHIYWIKVEPIIDQSTGQHAGYIAWINDDKPGELLYGQALRINDQPILFGDEFTALTNANMIKREELDRE